MTLAFENVHEQGSSRVSFLVSMPREQLQYMQQEITAKVITAVATEVLDKCKKELVDSIDNEIIKKGVEDCVVQDIREHLIVSFNREGIGNKKPVR